MAAISTETIDNEGITHLIGEEILDIRFVDVSRSPFSNPDSGFTGYAADGFWYTSGEADPTHTPYKAKWAEEGEHEEADSNRGVLDRFPDRIFIVTTASEVVILDADSLDVWMRFVTYEGSASSYGSFLGDEAVAVRQAAFIDGFLLVATDRGLRIADFRNDRAFVLDSAEAHQTDSSTNLTDRNSDGMLEGDIYTSYLTDGDCTCVDVGVVGAAIEEDASGGIVVAAVGHDLGMTGVVLLDGDSVSSPETKEHDDFQEVGLGSWEASDDGDGDSETPYIVRPSGSAVWLTKHVRAGDTLVLDQTVGPDLTVIVTEVTEDRVTVTPEIDLTSSGTDHSTHRSVWSVFVAPGGVLFFACGTHLVSRVSNKDWYTGGGEVDPRTGSTSTKNVLTHPSVSRINKVTFSGSVAYVATDQGVFVVTKAVFDGSGSNFSPAELRYASSASALTAAYEILEGDIAECVDVAVDPETGNILISTVEGEECVLTEIDPSIHQAFQFFDQDDLGGVVNCIVAYRNTEGPPDDESEVA
tara:strand:- start:1189 stop:2769 length:1581 start_codon:yes stop_codon:yes gene_type:complete